MGRRGCHQHDVFAGQDAAVSMNDRDTQQRPSFNGFSDVPLDFGFRHSRIMLKRERDDRRAILVAAANPSERHQRTDVAAAMCEIRRHHGRVKRLALQAYGRFHVLNVTRRQWRGYPPVMGGKNAISPAPSIAASARTCLWSMAARITFASLNA